MVPSVFNALFIEAISAKNRKGLAGENSVRSFCDGLILLFARVPFVVRANTAHDQQRPIGAPFASLP